jgi:hypothetical protein
MKVAMVMMMRLSRRVRVLLPTPRLELSGKVKFFFVCICAMHRSHHRAFLSGTVSFALRCFCIHAAHGFCVFAAQVLRREDEMETIDQPGKCR